MNTPGQKGIFVNRAFNSAILRTVLRRYWLLPLLLIVGSLLAAFIYLRYTKPMYESVATLQIESKDQGREVLDVEKLNTQDNISQEIELLRSRLLFSLAVKRLNMNISLFSKGTILTEERYLFSPFNVQPFALYDSSLCEVPVFVVPTPNGVTMKYELHGKPYSVKCGYNQRVKNEHFDVLFKVDNPKKFELDAKSNDLYFVFNHPEILVDRMMSSIQITPLDVEAKTVEIRATGYNALLCNHLVTAVAETFFNYDEESRKKSAENILGFIDEQLDSLSGELQHSKDSLSQFQRRFNLPDPENIGQNLTENLDDLQEQLFEIEREQLTLKLVLSKLRKEPNRLEIYRLLPEMLGKSYESSLTKQITDLHALLERKEDLQFDVTDEHTEIKSINARIQTKIESIRRSVEVMTDRLNSNASVLRGRISEYEREYFELPEKKMEYTRLKSIQDLNSEYYIILEKKKAEYSISNAGYASNNRILNPASLDFASVTPKKKLIYIAFFIIGLTLGLIYLLLRYLTFNEISTAEDLKSIIPPNATLLGTIPFIRQNEAYSQLVVQRMGKSILAEALRNIRTNLNFVHKDARTIAISSSISSEGKTFVALNLAGIIAISGKRVIVIDLDLRKPKVHLGFGVPNNKGVSSLIIGESTLEESTHSSGVEHLDFITAGPIPPNPSELIQSAAFEDLLEQLKSRYDVVVIDLPPVGLVTDGVKILANADVPVYIFKAEYSKRIFANRIRELFDMNQLTHLNVILNGVKKHSGGYGYGYGYGYDSNGYYENS